MGISNIKNQISKLHIKIKNFGFWFVILIFAFCILNFNCYAQPLSSTELINNAKLYDAKTVVYEGEVIGDVMVREPGAWINVNDGENAIGVWLSAALAKDIIYKGSYKAKGDWVEVTGAFRRSCPMHGGDLDIHALSIKRINPGRNIPERLILGKRNLAGILFIILSLVWILTLFKRK